LTLAPFSTIYFIIFIFLVKQGAIKGVTNSLLKYRLFMFPVLLILTPSSIKFLIKFSFSLMHVLFKYSVPYIFIVSLISDLCSLKYLMIFSLEYCSIEKNKRYLTFYLSITYFK